MSGGGVGSLGASHPREHNVEMDWGSVRPEDYLTPNDRFFVRSHSAAPWIDPKTWRLRIDGPGAGWPFELSYDELVRVATTSATRALECAGNARRFFAEAHGTIPPGKQ